MQLGAETTTSGVAQREFTVDGVPGVLWVPPGATGPRPLVLLGHGGGQDRYAPGVVARASRLVSAHGFAAAALDAPGHGDRPRSPHDDAFRAEFQRLRGAGKPVGDLVAADNAARAEQAVPEWQAALSALGECDHIGAGGPVGYWGVSLGSMIGLPLVAAEPRIDAAVLGLVGHTSLRPAAARTTVPVRFLLQWDDELVPRDDGLALFDAVASAEKSLHAHAGGHFALPRHAFHGDEQFLLRHLAAR